MKGVVISMMVVLAMVQLMVKPGEAITCGEVDASLSPCVPYLTQGGTPTLACCAGVKKIKGMATTTADKRIACSCVKDAANRYSNLKDDAAQSLPQKCGVQMDVPISRRVNCDMYGSVWFLNSATKENKTLVFNRKSGQNASPCLLRTIKNCGQVDASLAPCVPYLTQGGTPSPACCSGVKSIKGMAVTTEDKRAACNCCKDAANRYSNLKDDAAQALPEKCGVPMDIPISRTS